MATTPVKLTIDGFKDREVLAFSYEFNQETDITGQMSGIPRGGILNIRVKALNDGNPDLFSWMVEKDLAKNGTIIFNETRTGKKMKEIKFTNGYCIEYVEESEDNVGHYEEVKVTCQKIEFEGNVAFENAWE